MFRADHGLLGSYVPFPEKDLRKIPGIDLRCPVRFISYPKALATRRLSR
jgi:hypothetical protein